ncbi:hypothetical protein GCM10018783_34150 [Streptomyces griseosporeus]|nr:hypothetical protein GCM10018783_34150 [Streptomyces griseosporeus]
MHVDWAEVPCKEPNLVVAQEQPCGVLKYWVWLEALGVIGERDGRQICVIEAYRAGKAYQSTLHGSPQGC